MLRIQWQLGGQTGEYRKGQGQLGGPQLAFERGRDILAGIQLNTVGDRGNKEDHS